MAGRRLDAGTDRSEAFWTSRSQASRPPARPPPGKEILDIIRGEIANPIQCQRIEKRVTATIQYAMRVAWDTDRSGQNMRRAMEAFAEKDRQRDCVEEYEGAIADLEELLERGFTVDAAQPGPETLPNKAMERPPVCDTMESRVAQSSVYCDTPSEETTAFSTPTNEKETQND